MEEVDFSLRARLSASGSRSNGSPLRFLEVRAEPAELWADLTRDQESNEISVVVLACG